MNYALLLPELILVGLGLVLVAADLFFKGDKRQLVVIGVVGALASMAAVIANFGQEAELWGAQLQHDPYASFFKIVFLVILVLLFLSSPEYLRKRNMAVGEFYVLTTFATVGGFLMASSLDLVTIFLGLELLSIASYVLAGMLKSDRRSHEASIKLFLMGAVTTAVTLFGISLLYGLTGSTNLQDIGLVLANVPAAEWPLMAAAGLMILAGLGVKIAAVPFHMWAPDTYEGAPTPVSAFLITASEAAAFAILVRIFVVALPDLMVHWQTIIGVMALITMTYGNITAILQTRTKRMLAYSAVAQAGYILVGLAVASPAGVSAMLFYVFAYALMTVGAFTAVIFLSNHAPGEEIADFKGMARRSPLVALAVTVLLISLVGIPPTAGFFGKFLLYRAAVEANMVWLGLATVLNGAISVPYYYGIIRNMYFVEEGQSMTRIKPATSMAIVLAVTVAGTLLLGIIPEPLIKIVSAITVGP